MCHLSCVTCYVLPVMCPVSPVMCHLSHEEIMKKILKKMDKVVELVCGGSLINGAYPV